METREAKLAHGGKDQQAAKSRTAQDHRKNLALDVTGEDQHVPAPVLKTSSGEKSCDAVALEQESRQNPSTIVSQILQQVVELAAEGRSVRSCDTNMANSGEKITVSHTIASHIPVRQLVSGTERVGKESHVGADDNGQPTSACIVAEDDIVLLAAESGADSGASTSSCRDSSGASTSYRTQPADSSGSSKPKCEAGLEVDDSSASSSKAYDSPTSMGQTHPVWRVRRPPAGDGKKLYTCTFPDLPTSLSRTYTLCNKKFFRLVGQREPRNLKGKGAPVELLISFDMVDLFPPKVNIHQ
jgi:hypothetical protein